MSGLIFVLLLCVFGELILLLGPGMGVGGGGGGDLVSKYIWMCAFN